MNGTLRVYDRMADEYHAMAEGFSRKELAEFMDAVAPGAKVLDLGCGPGHHAARMVRAGFEVLAIDGSAEMVARAALGYGVDARQATFDDIPTFGPVGGIWASFSLLHAKRADLPRHLEDLHAICERGGPLYLGMKLGSGDGVDRLGRYYTYYSEAELRTVVVDAGFTHELTRLGSGKGLAGDVEDWITMFARA